MKEVFSLPNAEHQWSQGLILSSGNTLKERIKIFILSVYTQTIGVLSDKTPNQCKRHKKILLTGTHTLTPSAPRSPCEML